jgi:hypothetical protein
VGGYGPVIEEVVENEGPIAQRVQNISVNKNDGASQSLLQAVVASASRLTSIIVGPSNPVDPMVVVVPSLLKQVPYYPSNIPSTNFLIYLSILDINHDTFIPSYFNGNKLLIHLAFILSPQLGGQALEKIALDYLEEEEEDPEMIIEENEDDAMSVEGIVK